VVAGSSNKKRRGRRLKDATGRQRLVKIDGQSLTIDDLDVIARGDATFRFPREARSRVVDSAKLVASTAKADEPCYGINTGFGRFCNVRISPSDVRRLQLNLIRSHAAGVGEPLGPEEVRLAIALRANALAGGHGGVRPQVIELLISMLENDVLPRIPRLGSVGASGDLAPLAHLAQVLIGEGQALVDGKWVSGKTALKRKGLKPIQLEAKEGLSLINGVQISLAMLARALLLSRSVVNAADVTAALSIEGLLGSMQPFDPRIQEVRPHPGQSLVASHLRSLLAGSKIVASHLECDRVQDPYSLRCTPQVQGAVRDALDWIRQVVEREANSSTDNPLVFSEQGDVISGGNFHGAPVAYAADLLCIVVTDLASMSERRLEKVLNPDTNQGLPAFLAVQEGLESGWMMAQVTAAAIVSRMKVLSHPASVDSIVTSAGSEDHVSMSTHASEKSCDCASLAAQVVAIEMLVGLDALELRRPLRSGRRLEKRIQSIRAVIPKRKGDRFLSPELEQAAALIRDGNTVVP